MLGLGSLSPFSSAQDPGLRTVPLTFKVGLPTSVHSQRNLYGHAQRFEFWMILDPVNLPFDITHCLSYYRLD